MIKINNNKNFDLENFKNDLFKIQINDSILNIKDKYILISGNDLSFVNQVKVCTLAIVNGSDEVFINNKEFNKNTLNEIIEFYNSNTLSILINQEKRKDLVGFKINYEKKLKS